VSAHEPFPLTDVQAAYWAGEQDAFELGGVAAHLYHEYEMADLDVARLEAALRRLVERHELLRAIVLPDGRWRVLERVPPVHVRVVEAHGTGPDEVECALAAVRERMAAEGPSSGEWPLFEAVVSRLDGGFARLHLSVSLLLCDAWSTGVLLRDLGHLYANPDAALPRLETTFREHVLDGAGTGPERRRSDLAYWLERASCLSPGPALPLASGQGAPGRRFRRRAARLPRETWGRLRAACQAARITPSAALLTAYVDALAMRAASPQLTINVLSSHRPPMRGGLRDVIGNFSSTLLVGIDAAAAPAFATRAARVQEALLEAMEHASVSGVRVLSERNRALGRIGCAAMPVVFASLLHLGPLEHAAQDAALGRRLECRVQTPHVWLDHHVHEEGSDLVLTWDAVEELFEPGLLDELFGAYCGLLTKMAQDEGAWAAPGPPGTAGGDEVVTPRDGMEARLADIWEQVLEVAPIGVTDRFFDLGGTSLAALRVVARVREATGRDVPLAAFLSAPTVEDLAAWLRQNASPTVDDALHLGGGGQGAGDE
jgi:acyl carrier protein